MDQGIYLMDNNSFLDFIETMQKHYNENDNEEE